MGPDGRTWATTGRSFTKRSQEADNAYALSLAASFRELGPPDLCHVIKTTGRAGQKDVSPVKVSEWLLPVLIRNVFATMHAGRIVSLCLGSRRLVISIPSGVHQLAHLHRRGNLVVVLWFVGHEIRLASSRRRVLLVQRLLESRCPRRGQDPGWSRGVCDRRARRAVRRGFLFPLGLTALLAEHARRPADTKRHRRCGKKCTSLRFCARSSMPTTRVTASPGSANSTRLRPSTPNCASSLPLRLPSSKVRIRRPLRLSLARSR